MERFHDQLEELKLRIRKDCERMVDGEVNTDFSVTRYNMARDKFKDQYPVEVVCMLDSSGFVHELMSDQEKEWMKYRRLKKRAYARLDVAEKTFIYEYEKKGGQS